MQKVAVGHETKMDLEESKVVAELNELPDQVYTLPLASPAAQKLVLGHETLVMVSPESKVAMADQLEPLYSETLPAASPATHRLELAHDIEAMFSPESIVELELHELPL